VRLNALCFYCSGLRVRWHRTCRVNAAPDQNWSFAVLPARYWGRMLRRKDYSPRPAVEKRAIIVKWETGRVKSPTSG
jgi:hypothetical protein